MSRFYPPGVWLSPSCFFTLWYSFLGVLLFSYESKAAWLKQRCLLHAYPLGVRRRHRRVIMIRYPSNKNRTTSGTPAIRLQFLQRLQVN
ncbi:hypothetical protein Y032_0011g1526 [Ancylostoma ceylanicum]|uniref:Uncharacterized protein n=1 Tax=Ancylostoma ceylanicum TaxID=53326 RepID=A0A016VH39_9BILA|nr:hypothetical protein Y032_0011g1526 [Ancylostoma ceylanicum]